MKILVLSQRPLTTGMSLIREKLNYELKSNDHEIIEEYVVAETDSIAWEEQYYTVKTKDYDACIIHFDIPCMLTNPPTNALYINHSISLFCPGFGNHNGKFCQRWYKETCRVGHAFPESVKPWSDFYVNEMKNNKAIVGSKFVVDFYKERIPNIGYVDLPLPKFFSHKPKRGNKIFIMDTWGKANRSFIKILKRKFPDAVIIGPYEHDNMPNLFEDAAVVIVPYRFFEGELLILDELRYLNIPTIVTNHGGYANYIDDRTCFNLKMADIENIVNLTSKIRFESKEEDFKTFTQYAEQIGGLL